MHERLIRVLTEYANDEKCPPEIRARAAAWLETFVNLGPLDDSPELEARLEMVGQWLN